MRPCRLLITGASGTGTTTLGRALAGRWAVPHADVDDYYWVPASPPFESKRAPEDRLLLMEQVFLPRAAWVLSGSIMGWGDQLAESLDAVVLLTLDPATRMERLEQRQVTRYGPDVDSGPRQAGHREFLAWARGYDDEEFAGRSRAQHERWLSQLSCPVLRLDSAQPAARLVQAVVAG